MWVCTDPLGFFCSPTPPAPNDPEWWSRCTSSPTTVQDAWVLRSSEPRKTPTPTYEDTSWATPTPSTDKKWAQGVRLHSKVFLG